MTKRFRIEQIAPDLPHTWATTESFDWDQEVIDILKKDINGTLFKAAHDSVDWRRCYEELKDTPFYRWAEQGCGILAFGGPGHIEENKFFSHIGDICLTEEEFLKEHPEYNQVLHDLHIEAAEQMIRFILEHAPEEI